MSDENRKLPWRLRSQEEDKNNRKCSGRIDYKLYCADRKKLPCDGKIVIYYPSEMVWWDVDSLTKVQSIKPYPNSNVHGRCEVKYRYTTYIGCYYRKFGEDPGNLNWGKTDSIMKSLHQFTHGCSKKEDIGNVDSWIDNDNEESDRSNID